MTATAAAGVIFLCGVLVGQRTNSAGVQLAQQQGGDDLDPTAGQSIAGPSACLS